MCKPTRPRRSSTKRASTFSATFELLGYSDQGTYAESFSCSMRALPGYGVDHNLAGYGVGSDEVAEVVLLNQSGFGASIGGVRTQRFNPQPLAESGASRPGDHVSPCKRTHPPMRRSTFMPNQLSTTSSTGRTLDRSAGVLHREGGQPGSPTLDLTWQDKSLGGYGVPADSVVEIAIGNLATGFGASANQMGVRPNGSVASRLLDLDEPASGGNYARMHVAADATSTIEWYHEDVSRSPDAFRLVGFGRPTAHRWRSTIRTPPPRTRRWSSMFWPTTAIPTPTR